MNRIHTKMIFLLSVPKITPCLHYTHQTNHNYISYTTNNMFISTVHGVGLIPESSCSKESEFTPAVLALQISQHQGSSGEVQLKTDAVPLNPAQDSDIEEKDSKLQRVKEWTLERGQNWVQQLI